jgi:hypothetical protein
MAGPGWPKSIPESLLGSYSSRQYMDALPNRKKFSVLTLSDLFDRLLSLLLQA